jgi:hypothetical protein
VPPLVPADHGVVIRSASQQSLDKIMCFPANSHPQLSQLVGGIVRLVAHGVMHFDREAGHLWVQVAALIWITHILTDWTM